MIILMFGFCIWKWKSVFVSWTLLAWNPSSANHFFIFLAISFFLRLPLVLGNRMPPFYLLTVVYLRDLSKWFYISKSSLACHSANVIMTGFPPNNVCNKKRNQITTYSRILYNIIEKSFFSSYSGKLFSNKAHKNARRISIVNGLFEKFHLIED